MRREGLGTERLALGTGSQISPRKGTETRADQVQLFCETTNQRTIHTGRLATLRAALGAESPFLKELAHLASQPTASSRSAATTRAPPRAMTVADLIGGGRGRGLSYESALR